MKSEVWIKSYGLLKIFEITRVKNAYQIRRTVRCVFEAPRVLETVQYMSRMKALGLLIPKVTLGSRIGGLDQKLWPLEVRSLFPSAEPPNRKIQDFKAKPKPYVRLGEVTSCLG